MLARKYIEIDGLKIAYSEVGKGTVVLMVHGFASSSFTWTRLIPHLPKNRRYLMLDLKGFGYSDKSLDGRFSPVAQAAILAAFAEKLKLKNLVLVGHSFGGLVSVLSLLKTSMRGRVRKLILLDSAGFPNQLPPFVRQLKIPFANNLVFSYVNSEILSKVILEETYFDKSRIADEFVMEYASLMRLPGAIDCLIKSAERMEGGEGDGKGFARLLGRLDLPTLVLWGENDGFIPVADAKRFEKHLPSAELAVIPRCGHAPQEECPKRTSAAISDFIAGRKIGIVGDFDTGVSKAVSVVASDSSSSASGTGTKARHPRMSSLIDRWSPSIFLMFVFVKILQILKTLGIRARESGWRKTMGTYLRTEHSKFALGVFGLDYLSDMPTLKRLSRKKARTHLIGRLSEFLKETPSSHWKLRWDKFSVFRERRKFVDIVEVDFDSDGKLLEVVPHWDADSPPFNEIDAEKDAAIRAAVVEKYNNVRNARDVRRPILLRRDLRRWAATETSGSSRVAELEVLSYVDRVLSGDWISFHVHEGDAPSSPGERFIVPDFIKRKHAGHGLLNIVCRFNRSLDEVDFWFQFQHVPVDGVPMQEFLLDLKRRWGIRRQVVYPSLNPPPKPVVQRCSTSEKEKHALYQTTTLVDFRPILALRKRINAQYADRMGGSATVVSFVMWGLTMHSSLKDRKFIFPVELAECKATGQERAPSAIFIRPSAFADPARPLKGFFDFQYEFNRRMNATRARKSESYELIELYAILFPWLYTLTRKFMPRAVAEFTGTVGLTMIKDADMFITPLSDIQSDGFFAIGNLLVDTEDGGKAGCASIRASKDKIPLYLDAFANLRDNLDRFFGGALPAADDDGNKNGDGK